MLDVNYVCVLKCEYVHTGVRGGQRCWTPLGLGYRHSVSCPTLVQYVLFTTAPFLQIQQTAVRSGLALLHSVLLT